MQTVTKPSGWKGKKGDRYWYRSTTFGVRSKCSDCGKETLGWASDTDRRFHKDTCPRVAGPRKEWKCYVDATGKAHVHRLTTESKECYLTRKEALRALDAELAAQIETITKQRAEVARMLSEPEAT